MVQINIKIKDLVNVATQNSFPKYSTQLMNLANSNAQGTRPKIVGQLTELIPECGTNDYDEWVRWYLERYPNAIDNATEKTYDMLLKLK